MKTIFKSTILMAVVGLSLFTSCKDDNESNPTLIQPASFVVNNPAIGSANLDLAKSTSVNLTWSQPTFTNFGAPVIPTYTVQISPSGSFNKQFDANLEDNTGADFISLAETYSSGSADINTATVNRALLEMMGWSSEAEVPALLPLSIRVKAAVQDASFNEYYPIYSNIIALNTIPYYIELKPADPEIWWLIGADISDGSWGSDIGKSVIPMQTIDGFAYDSKTGQGEIQWIGYLGGNGFKLRGALDDGWASQWGQGDSFGSFVKNDGGSGNITVPEAGIYTVSLNTIDDKLSIEPYDGSVSVFSGMAIAGSFNDWGDTDMTPCSTGWENHDWYIVTTLDAGAEIKIKEAGSWDYNRGGSFVTYGDGMYVYGVQNGDNLVIPETATYMILFNDITGYIRFIKQ
jgi:hypothetical protein